jgi:hypothetical protein
MPGRAYAVTTGTALVTQVLQLADKLGLEAQEQVKVGRRLWGAVRNIDVVLTHPDSRLRLGVECKFQGTPGTAEEKIPAILSDIDAWPIRGIVVISGKGFSPNMRYFLISSGWRRSPSPGCSLPKARPRSTGRARPLAGGGG